MDIAAYQAYAAAHPAQAYAAAAAFGAVASRPAVLADLAFKGIMKTPLKLAVIKAWPSIKAWLDAFEDRFGLDVEAEKAADAAAPAAAPAPQAATAPTPDGAK